MVKSNATYGLSDLVLSGFLRIVTHPRILKTPLSSGDALRIVQNLRRRQNCFIVKPGERHWHIFSELCQHVKATANSVPDAYFAALAIESGCEWITADKGFARFPGLRWRHPLNGRPALPYAQGTVRKTWFPG
jgi:toxin-antitoxin system PIN domain toxin